MKVSGQLNYSGALPPGVNVPLPIECTTSFSIWPSGRFGYEENISCLNSDQDSLCIREMRWCCGVANGLQAGRSGSPIQAEATDFSPLHNRPNLICGPPSPLPNGYQCYFPEGKVD